MKVLRRLLSGFTRLVPVFMLMLALQPSSANAFGEETRFKLAVLELDPSVRERTPGLITLARGIRARTSIDVALEPVFVPLESEAVFTNPMLILPVCRELPPLGEDRARLLRRWLDTGGLLLVDNCQGRAEGAAARWISRELGSLFPRRKVEALATEHSVFRSFYLLDRAYGRTSDGADLRGISEGDRTMVVFSPNDLLGALMVDAFGNPIYDVGSRTRELALRQGINTVLYALTLNYKRDQIHIPFILKRRQP